MSGIFLVFVTAIPILPPIGVIETSAPRVKNPIPITTITEPIKKLSNKSGRIGTAARHRTATIRKIGSTEPAASFIFSKIAVRFFPSKSKFKSFLRLSQSYRQTRIIRTRFLRANFSHCCVKILVNPLGLTAFCALLCKKSATQKISDPKRAQFSCGFLCGGCDKAFAL